MFDCNSLANINLSRVYIFSRKWVNITQIALNACTQFIDSIRVLVRIIEKKLLVRFCGTFQLIIQSLLFVKK